MALLTKLRWDDTVEELINLALLSNNPEPETKAWRVHRLVQEQCILRTLDIQEYFEAAVTLLLMKLPSSRGNTYDNDEWLAYERYVPHVLSLMKRYNQSEARSSTLKSNMDFVRLLINAAQYSNPFLHWLETPLTAPSAIRDNDTARITDELLDTANQAYHHSPEPERDQLLWADLLSLKCMSLLVASNFSKAESVMSKVLRIRLNLLCRDDQLVVMAYNWLSVAIASQGRFSDGLQLLLKAGEVFEGPANDVPAHKVVWQLSIARNYYCMDMFAEAEPLLAEAVAYAESRPSWYQQV
jgi:tetratricopeptide (TPR) repeat protein